MKNILIVIMSLILCVSCAENKTFITKDGTSFTASPYGWFNKESRIDGVVYVFCVETKIFTKRTEFLLLLLFINWIIKKIE